MDSAVSCGFTLAEVLVTLGIIGVISAMTMPTLIKNHQREVFVTQLRKFYSEFSQVIIDYQSKKNAVNLIEAGLSSPSGVNTFMNEEFKIVKTCEDAIEPCFAGDYKTIKGGTVGIDISTSYVLANGVSIRMLSAIESVDKIANIMVDINGKNGPNVLGRDLFFIALYKDGTMDDYVANNPAPLTHQQRETAFASCTSSNYSSGWGCFGKILNDNWKMNY